jgi:putative aldouronate transport system permease protein
MMRRSFLQRTFETVNVVYLTVLALVMVLPFLLVLGTSLSTEKSIILHGYTIWPREFSLDAYKFVIRGGSIFRAYGVSIFVTLVGTLIAVLITSMAGYAISRKSLRYRNAIALIFYFTMLFNGGIVPWYIMINNMGLRNSIWVLILPICFSPFLMLLIRNFFLTLPDAVIESVKLDGAGEMTIFLKIIIPMSLPGFATITLFYMLSFWNDWWLALCFIDKEALFPLQYLLRKVLSSTLYAGQGGMQSKMNVGTAPTETAKTATSIFTIGPIILVYPFIQKYFIKGITIGAVKG